MSLPYTDKQVYDLAKGGVVSALIARYVTSHVDVQTFHKQAEEILKDVPYDVLRDICGEVIRSFGYGREPTDVLTLIELYDSSTSTKIG